MQPPADPDRRLYLWLFVAFAALYLLTSGGHFYASDDLQKFQALDAWVRTGVPAFPDGWSVGRGGLHYAWFTLGSSLLMLPGYGLGRALESLVPWLPGPFVVRFCIALQNALFTAATAVAVAAFARRLGGEPRASVFAAACFGLGTMAWPYAKTAWSEPGATCLLFVACLFLVEATRAGLAAGKTLAAGVLVALALSVRLELAVVLPGTLAWLVWRFRREPATLGRALALLALPLAGAVAAALWYNVVRYGTLTSFANFAGPQGAIVFPPGGRPVWGLVNIWHYTLNPADGTLWYAPAVLAGLVGWRAFYRACRTEAGLLLAALVPLFCFFTFVWGLSDWAWGQRYAYVFLPFLCLPAAWAWQGAPARRPLLLALAGFGLAVQLVAVPVNFNYLYERYRAAHGDVSIQQMMADAYHPPLAMAAAALPPTLAGGVALLAVPRPTASLPVAAYRQRAQFVPDVWPFLLLLSPAPRWAIAAAVLALAAALGLALTRLYGLLASAS